MHQRTRNQRCTTFNCGFDPASFLLGRQYPTHFLTGLAKHDSERSPRKAVVVKVSHELNIEGREVTNDTILKKRQGYKEQPQI